MISKTLLSLRTLNISQLLPLCLLLIITGCGEKAEKIPYDFTTSYEKSGGTETATYEEVIEFYEELSKAHTAVAMYNMGRTDSGRRLNLITYNPNRSFESEFSGSRDEIVILINNAIHPGESDGVDASMMLMRDLAENKIQIPENVILAIIPIYNIGGALNRNSGTRTNQNGPKEYGFRGNARNYDLNRDFIKADTKNARSFADLYNTVKPDIFIDTHVSNGADYQYVLTHLLTQHNKLGGPLGEYLDDTFTPQLEASLEAAEWPITPYVNVFNRTPETGFSQFFDSPRYSSGYASLFHALSLMVETHMLKPYDQRVEGTYQMLKTVADIAGKDAEVIINLRKAQDSLYRSAEEYAISWKLDSSKTRTLNFKGYKAEMTQSDLTGGMRLQYNKSEPYERELTYYNNFMPEKTIVVPEYYVVPRGYWNVIDRLKENKIEYETLEGDSLFTAEVYTIESYETSRSPYEGHYPHYNTEVSVKVEEVNMEAGSLLIPTDQRAMRYLLETLEPAARDSFFNWNYFDSILRQKEGFSPYVWEDKAKEFLEDNPDIKKTFEEKKLNEPEFKDNWYRQLEWIHKQSIHYEKAHLRYPVIRVGG